MTVLAILESLLSHRWSLPPIQNVTSKKYQKSHHKLGIIPSPFSGHRALLAWWWWEGDRPPIHQFRHPPSLPSNNHSSSQNPNPKFISTHKLQTCPTNLRRLESHYQLSLCSIPLPTKPSFGPLVDIPLCEGNRNMPSPGRRPPSHPPDTAPSSSPRHQNNPLRPSGQ